MNTIEKAQLAHCTYRDPTVPDSRCDNCFHGFSEIEPQEDRSFVSFRICHLRRGQVAGWGLCDVWEQREAAHG